MDLDGVAVYPLAVGGGTVYLAEDGAIELIEDVEVTALNGTGSFTGTVDPRAVGAEQILRFGEDLAALSGEWSEVLFFANFSADDTVVNENAVCDVLVCTVEADISFEESIGVAQAYSPVVEFTGTISTGVADVGDATCSQTKTVELGVTVHFECTADLTPNSAPATTTTSVGSNRQQ